MRAALFASIIAWLGLSVPVLAAEGFYAHGAVSLWTSVGDNRVGVSIPAPDKRSSALARWLPESRPGKDDERVEVKVSGVLGRLIVPLGPGVNSELLWRADSAAFAVTTSDGGGVGTYRTLAVGRFRGRLEIFDVSPLVWAAFGHPVRCGWPEHANVGAIGWTAAGRLVVAAEIKPHSNCDSMGTFRAYEIDLATRRIVGGWDQIAAKKRFASMLGQELRTAPDDCLRTPQTCWISTNHPEKR